MSECIEEDVPEALRVGVFKAIMRSRTLKLPAGPQSGDGSPPELQHLDFPTLYPFPLNALMPPFIACVNINLSLSARDGTFQLS